MTTIQLLGWTIGAAYVALFLLATIIASRRSSAPIWLFAAPGQRLPALGFRLGFVILLIWPLDRSFDRSYFICLLLAALGAALALYGQLHMGRSWRIGAAEGATGSLVTDGPFAISRNPVFLGQIILSCALVPFGGWLMLLGAALITASAIVQVRREEAVMSNDLAWRDYAARTPRWLGRR